MNRQEAYRQIRCQVANPEMARLHPRLPALLWYQSWLRHAHGQHVSLCGYCSTGRLELPSECGYRPVMVWCSTGSHFSRAYSPLQEAVVLAMTSYI